MPVGHQPSLLSELVLEKRTALGYALKEGVLTSCKQLPLLAGFLPLTEQARGQAKGRKENKDEGVVWVVDRPCSNPPHCQLSAYVKTETVEVEKCES